MATLEWSAFSAEHTQGLAWLTLNPSKGIFLLPVRDVVLMSPMSEPAIREGPLLLIGQANVRVPPSHRSTSNNSPQGALTPLETEHQRTG
jgi:hypothetical protein